MMAETLIHNLTESEWSEWRNLIHMYRFERTADEQARYWELFKKMTPVTVVKVDR